MLTDEHEHAMKVWREALQAGQQDWPKPIDDRAAAAVIAADRAGLVAEIERLREALRKSWAKDQLQLSPNMAD